MINYSIIIPHKNSQELLAYGLSTIPVRDDVQVIVVDDNSDPQKVDFEHFPQWKGKNYEYYLTKEGKGAGYARNVGLDHAKGKWVLFVDADDYLLPTINKIFDECVDSEADVIYFRPKAVVLGEKDVVSKRADEYIMLISEYLETEKENNIRTRFYVPWSKFVRKTLIDKHHIRFDEIPYSNDVAFSIKVGCCAPKIAAKNLCYYVVTRSAHSLTTNMWKDINEIKVRAVAFIESQKVIYDYGWVIEEKKMILFFQQLFLYDRVKFIRLLKLMLSCGYSRVELINKIFADNSRKARIKRGLYVFLKTI